MAKVRAYNITFDSELEVKYYEKLVSEELDFIYHPKSIELEGNRYTPDFLVIYDDRVEIIETKGYNQFSYLRDNMIHNLMLHRKPEELVEYCIENEIDMRGKEAVYKKIKYLAKFGFVDYSFKNPNTRVSMQKDKISYLRDEVRVLTKELRDYKRFYNLIAKEKLTKSQRVWLESFKKRVDSSGSIKEE